MRCGDGEKWVSVGTQDRDGWKVARKGRESSLALATLVWLRRRCSFHGADGFVPEPQSNETIRSCHCQRAWGALTDATGENPKVGESTRAPGR